MVKFQIMRILKHFSKNKSVSILILLVPLLILYLPIASAATYYIDAVNGIDGRTCKDAKTDTMARKSFREGIKCLAGGDTLRVKPGTYTDFGIGDQNIQNSHIPNGLGESQNTIIEAFDPKNRPWLIPSLDNTGERRNFIFNFFSSQHGEDSYITIDGINMKGTNVQFHIVKVSGTSHHITLKNFEVTDTTVSAVQFFGTGNNVIDNMNCHDIAEIPDPGFAASHCVYIGSPNNIVQNSLMGPINDPLGNNPSPRCIQMASFPQPPFSGSGNIFRNNICHGTDTGFMSNRNTGGKIYNNIFYNIDQWAIHAFRGTGGTEIYNNTIYNIGNVATGPLDGTNQGAIIFGGNNCKNIEIRNNIIHTVDNDASPGSGNGIAHTAGSACDDVRILNNIIWDTSGSAIKTSGATNVIKSGNLLVDPLLVDPANQDFSLQAGSPALEAGACPDNPFCTGTVGNKDSPTPPMLSFTASQTSIILGNSATLSWSSSDATSCTASGGWSGTKALSGSQLVSPTQTTTYTLTCTGDGSATKSLTISVLASQTDAPVAHWRFDEGSGSKASDSSGNQNTGTLLGLLGGPTWVAGKIGGALKFDGIDDYVNIPHNNIIDFGDEDFSITFWMKAASGELLTGDNPLIKGTSAAYCGGGKRFQYMMDIVPTKRVNGNFIIDDNIVKSGTFSTFPIKDLDGKWHHTALIRDAANDEIKEYYDGTELITATGVLTGDISNNCPLYIARMSDDTADDKVNQADAYAKFTIDDLRIYSRVVSPSEVQDIFNLNDPYIDGTPSTKFAMGDKVEVISGPVDVRSTPSTSGTLLFSQPTGALGTIIGGPTTADGFNWWQIDYDTVSIPEINPDGWSVEDSLEKAVITCTFFTYSAWGACQSDNTQTRTVTSSSPSGCTGGTPILTQSCTFVRANTTGGLIAHYKFDGDATDSSGNGNSGTIIGNPTFTTGQIGQALDFDGVDDYVSVPHQSNIDFTDEDFSYSFWVKLSSQSGRVLVKGTSSGGCGAGKRYEVIYNAIVADLEFYIDDNVVKTGIGSDTLEQNKWYHAVYTRNTATNEINIYIDGVLQSQSPATDGTGSISNNCDLYFGSNNPVGNHPIMQLDDFRIYNRILSAQEIQGLYNEGVGTTAGDVNEDGTVDLSDISLIVQYFGQTSGFDPRADARADGLIDLFDVMVVVVNWS